MDAGTQGKTIVYRTMGDMGTIGAIVLMKKGQVTMQRRTMGMMWEVNCPEKEM